MHASGMFLCIISSQLGWPKWWTWWKECIDSLETSSLSRSFSLLSIVSFLWYLLMLLYKNAKRLWMKPLTSWWWSLFKCYVVFIGALKDLSNKGYILLKKRNKEFPKLFHINLNRLHKLFRELPNVFTISPQNTFSAEPGRKPHPGYYHSVYVKWCQHYSYTFTPKVKVFRRNTFCNFKLAIY